jgi:Relaxase/Mobilisation nuclease domain
MIAKIMKSANSFQAVYYNEHKIEGGKAVLMVAANFNQDGFNTMNTLTKSDYIAYFMALSKLNSRVKNRQFHAVLSAKGQSYNAEELKTLAEEYLYRMGYGASPYLIYFHQDTDNNHVHLISTRVNTEGVKINDSFEKRESLRHIENIMKQIPRQELTGANIANQFTAYGFTTEGQLKTLITSCENQPNKQYEVEIDRDNNWQINQIKDGQSRQIAMIEQGRVAARIKETTEYKPLKEERENRKSMLKAILNKYKNTLSTEELKKYLKDKMGVDLIFHQAENQSKPFGYTVIDHAQKQIYKGSEILKMSELIAQTQNHKEALGTLAEAKNKTKGVGNILDYLNDHDLILIQKGGEPFLLDTMNNEIESLTDVRALMAMIGDDYRENMSDKIYAMDFPDTFSFPPVASTTSIEISNQIHLPSNEEEDIKQKRKPKKYMGY